MQIGFVVILIIAIFVAIFSIQNGIPVEVDLFLFRIETPLAVVMMVCLILGAVIVLILGTYRQFKKGSEIRELKNKVKVLDTEKGQLENNVKAMEAEIQTLKESNNTLSKRVEDLQSKNKEQENSLVLLENELKDCKTKLETEIISEGDGSELNNEKTEAISE